MKRFLPIIALFVIAPALGACGLWSSSQPDEEEIVIRKDNNDYTMRSGTSAFDSCPPMHAEQGRC